MDSNLTHKTKAIPISVNKTNFSNFPPIFLNSTKIQYVTEAKNLGIIFNNTLSWNTHITSVVSKIYASLRGLSVTKQYLPVEIKLKLVKALIIPILTYGCELFADPDYQSLQKLNVAFNSIARFVFNLRRYDHVSSHAQQLLGCSLQAFLKYRCCSFLFKLIVNQTPSYLFDKLNFCSSNRFILLRSFTFNNLTSRRQFFVYAVRLWNHIPSHLKTGIENRTFHRLSFEYFCNMN